MGDTKSKNGLLPLAFRPLPLGSIRPEGWLARQLRIQADGLTGRLEDFWPDIRDSAWIGGEGEGWERGPYWLDGLVPLAFALDDEKLKATAGRWMDYILTHQADDGWLGPEHPGREARDPWPRFVLLKVMTQYHEATGDGRVVPAMGRFLRCLGEQLGTRPLFDWGRSRWADLVVSIHWLFDRTGERWLLELAELVRSQGYDWRSHFAAFHYPERLTAGFGQHTHVVNNAMAVKTPGVWYRQSAGEGDRLAVYEDIETLDKYHGQVNGVFSGDEHYAGLMPSQGTELCAVVEYMFSLEVLTAILADVALADRLERIAFNALPATISPDWWSHQYDQQVNQVLCRVAENRPFATNGPDANTFGLEPNYGCCTANMHQGWPKFASRLWMATPDGGLAATAYAPATVTANLKGASVRVECETDYPFGEELKFTVRTDKSVEFPLLLRIPAWADAAAVTIDGRTSPAKPGAFHRIERSWQGDTAVELRLPMPVRIERRFNNAAAVIRGPLVYSLPVGEYWKHIKGEKPHADYEIYPTTPWNYALELNEAAPEQSISFESRPVGDCPFSPQGAPLRATVKGRRLPEWVLENNAAGAPPPSPVKSDQPLDTLTLVPYGSTNLRVTEFPTLS